MRAQYGWPAAFLGMGLFGAALAGASHHCTRPACCPGLPVYDYQTDVRVPTRSVLSDPALVIEQRPPFDAGVAPPGYKAMAAPVVRERLKVFQLPVSGITLDHCSISRVALTLHENGYWTLSLQADQNPWMTGPLRVVSTPVQIGGPVSAVQPPIPATGKQTNDLKRNLFTIRVRCYGNYPLSEAANGAVPGKPVLLELAPAPFWVQRGIPYDLLTKEFQPEVGRYFDLIDRVEVEFSYR